MIMSWKNFCRKSINLVVWDLGFCMYIFSCFVYVSGEKCVFFLICFMWIHLSRAQCLRIKWAAFPGFCSPLSTTRNKYSRLVLFGFQSGFIWLCLRLLGLWFCTTWDSLFNSVSSFFWEWVFWRNELTL